MITSSPGERYLAVTPRFVDCGRARLPVRRFGDGEPVLLIHGWPLSGFTWRKVLPALSARYACHAVDLAGAGDSEWEDDNDFSFHGHADHLRKVIDELNLSRLRIVAHNTGATVARRLAVIAPERVSHLVLIDTEIPNHRPPLVPLLQKLMTLPGASAVFGALLRSRRYRLSNSGFGGCFRDRSLIEEPEFLAQFIQPLIASKGRRDGQLLYARGIDWKQLDQLAEDHAKITARVLLLWGERDPFFPIALARGMVSQFRACDGLIQLDGAKLLPHEEFPEIVSRHLLDFFARS